MTDFASAHASGGSPGDLVRDCAAGLGDTSGHSLGFVYATSPLAGSFGAVVAALREATGVESWVGTAGHGILATGAEHFEEPALAVLTCRLATADFRLLPPVRSEKEARTLAADPMAAIGIVHADPRNGAVAEIVAGVAGSRGAYLVGGLTSADGTFPQVAGDRVVDGGVSGVLLGGRGLRVSVGLTQGCSPVGKAHAVTEGDGQVIATLDGRPAFEVLREDAGAAEGDDPRRWLANLHAALPVQKSDRADYMVRNLVGIDPERGLVAIADVVEPGDRVMFVRRDRTSAERDLARMLADVKARTGPAPKAALYFSCLARGPSLFRGEAYEARAIREALGDIPVAGFFGNGEIAHDRLYGYTGVLTVFA